MWRRRLLSVWGRPWLLLLWVWVGVEGWGCRARLGRFRGLAGLERSVLGVLGGGFRVLRGPVWRRWLSREAVL